MKRRKFEKVVRVVWVLASKDGCVLAHGHPDPGMPPYHLDPLTDRLPVIVHGGNRETVGDARRAWNSFIRKDKFPKRTWDKVLVHERKVTITIEEAT